MATTLCAVPSGISEALWARMTARLISEQAKLGTDIDQAEAELWLDELVLVFLPQAGVGLAPSGPVDAAWHVFMDYLGAYIDYCTERFGHVILHEPNDDPDEPSEGGVARSLEFFRERGVSYRPRLWGDDAGACRDVCCAKRTH